MKKRIICLLLVLVIVSTLLPVGTLADSNEQQIYNYLTGTMGMNSAAACGVLANIEKESSFSPTAQCVDTNGLTSYGICQWNGSRFTALKNYCANHGYSYSSLNGQLHYLQSELEGSESAAYSTVKNVANTVEGAYNAGYNWAKNFERCAQYWNGVDQFVTRANSAKNTYWPKYGGSSVDITTPGKPVLLNVQSTYASGSTATLIWNKTENTTHYNLWIQKQNYSGEWCYYMKKDYANSGYSLTLSVGKYRAFVYSYNSDAWESDGSDWKHTCSDYVYFDVYQNNKISFDVQGGTFADTCSICSLDHINDWNGLNSGRGSGELVVFMGADTVNDTNSYGYEVAVNSAGYVTGKRVYGEDKQLTVPYQGFVLSGHGTTSSKNAAFVSNINIGDYVAYDSKTMTVYHYKDVDELQSENKYVATGAVYGNLPCPTKEGFYFAGWYDTNGKRVTSDSEYYTNSLYAQWVTAETAKPSGTITYNNHRYERYDFNITWEDANALCQELGGHLVSITSASEQRAVEGLIDGGSNYVYFIGCFDSDVEGTWIWVTGETINYDNWDPQYPEPDAAEGYNYGGIINKPTSENKQFGEWLSNLNRPNSTVGKYRLCNYGFICEYDTIHSHSYTATVTSPTCIEQGYTIHTCACGDSFIDTYVEALGHDYKDGECTRCGAADPDYKPKEFIDRGKLVVSNERARAGEEVTVSVSLSDNPGIMVMALGVDYDHSKLQLIGHEDGVLTGWYVANNAVWVGDNDVTANGVILKLKFKVLDDAEEGDVRITLLYSDGDIANHDETIVRPTIENGKVTVIIRVPGDVTGDGKVNALDLLRMKKYLAGEDVTLEGSADVTGDGNVNALDLLRLKKYLAGENVTLG